MFFKNQLGGIVPNFPIQHSIVEMQRQVAELNGELRAAGCRIVQNYDEFLIEVPAGTEAKVDDIIKRHHEMFKGPVVSKAARMSIGGKDAETEVQS